MGCADACIEKKKGRFWGEIDGGYLPSGSNKVKVETVVWVVGGLL